MILPFPGRDPFTDDVVTLPRKDPFAEDDKGPFGSAQEVGRACAEEVGIDNVPAFTACTGRRVILSESQQKFVQCAEKNTGGSTRKFATCALDGQLSDDQRAAAECAMESEGDVNQFANCAADRFLDEKLTDEQQAAVECAMDSDGDAESFASCAATQIMGGKAT
ncbi:hypothetical protein, partial [Rhizobium sp. PEPV16]|uniref:hypothetical protein n=1 Tax=Rhizobium sp. PEPV16 TaxID=1820614 RepID=UPI00124C6486